ncbi:MAG: hypothetical protein GXO66_04765 [Euryarchaeota archaeon]|nr:hypothetical protein [Euryarchaeota archaeon]
MRVDKKLNISKLLIIFIPVILSWVFLFNPYERYDLTRENVSNGEIVKVSPEDVFTPGLKTAIKSIFDKPFNLQYYDVCFENNVEKMNNTIINISVNFNSEKIIPIPPGETVCVPILFDKPFTYNWIINVMFPVNLSEVHEYGIVTVKIPIGGKLVTYAKPEIWSTFAKWVLVFFTWSGLILLCEQIIKFIKT